MSSLVEVTIRSLGAGDWALLRTLRIRALTDAPDAFGPTVEEVSREPEEYWRRGARGFAEGEADLLVAYSAGEAVGLASAVADRERVGHIGAMWVDPGVRGSGIGRSLAEAARDALVQRGCHRIELWVTEGNERACRLYQSLGFAFTGTAQPLRAGSALRNLEMALVASTDGAV